MPRKYVLSYYPGVSTSTYDCLLGLSCAPDIFQEKMSELMTGLEFAKTHLDDLLCLTNGSFEDHLDNLRLILEQLKEAGLKVNASKSTFAQIK
jgi:hypothetical protein